MKPKPVSKCCEFTILNFLHKRFQNVPFCSFEASGKYVTIKRIGTLFAFVFVACFCTQIPILGERAGVATLMLFEPENVSTE